MNIIKRVTVSIIVAVFVSLMTVVFAAAGGPYTMTENPLHHVYGPATTPVPTSASGCRGTGTNCDYMVQNNSNMSIWGWATMRNNVYQWYAYVPYVGQAAMWLAPYNENWSVVVNQANTNEQGTFVYLGYSDYLPNSSYFLEGSNECIAGYYCGGLKVYWDDIEYTTSP